MYYCICLFQLFLRERGLFVCDVQGWKVCLVGRRDAGCACVAIFFPTGEVAAGLLNVFGRPSDRLSINIAKDMAGMRFRCLVSSSRLWVEDANARMTMSSHYGDEFDTSTQKSWRWDLVGVGGCNLSQAMRRGMDVQIGRDMRELCLMEVQLGRSWAEWIGTGLARNPPLEALCLEWCGLTDEGLCAISRTLSQNTCLKRLYLSQNRFGPNGFMSLVSNAPASLVYLDVSHNEVGSDKAAAALEHWLQSNPSLQVLDVRSTQLTAQHVRAAARHVMAAARKTGRPNSNLVTLKADWFVEMTTLRSMIVALPTRAILSWNKIFEGKLEVIEWEHTPQFEEESFAALETNTHLRSLTMRQCNVPVQKIANVLRLNHTLKSLSLCGSTHLGDTGFGMLLKALAGNTSLTELDVRDCHIHGEGVGDGMVASLSRLDLSENNLFGDSFPNVCKWLEKLPLLVLGLSSCGLGLEEGVLLGEMLQNNRKLTSLNLNGNGFGSEGARAIGLSLCHNVCLSTLLLSKCRCGSVGAQYIASGLRDNKTLSTLEFGGNCVDDEDMYNAHFERDTRQFFSEMLRTNTYLVRLYYEGCNAEELRRPLHRNETMRSAARDAALCFVACRKFRRSECGRLGVLNEHTFLTIAKLVWASRGDTNAWAPFL